VREKRPKEAAEDKSREKVVDGS